MVQRREISIEIEGEKFSVGPTVLADAELRFELGTHQFKMRRRALERLAPQPSIVLECSYDAQTGLDRDALRALRGVHGKEIKAQIVSDLVVMDAEVFASVPSEWGFNARANPLTFHFSRDKTPDQKSPALTEASFGIVNMTVLTGFGHFVDGSSRMEAIGGANLVGGDWTIQIREHPFRRKIKRYLQTIGGYGITHIASMYKSDGSSFGPDEVLLQMANVRLFLSFSNGAWVGTCRLTGADAHWHTVWQYWQNYPATWSAGERTESWLWTNTHFNRHESNAMATLFPLYMKATASDDSIGRSIERYLTANATQPFMDFTSMRTMGEMAAAVLYPAGTGPWRKFAEDLKCAGLNLNIPDECRNLQALYENNPEWAKSQKYQLASGPKVLRELRDYFEHPKNKINALDAKYAERAMFEAWHLSQWYLETIILNKCGYQGDRGNRMKGGEWGPLP